MRLEPCVPPIWARTGHAQTLIGYFMPSPKLASKGERHEIILVDNEPRKDGFVDRLVAFVHKGRRDEVVYLFHGLSGDTDSTYMHRSAQVALDLGFSVVMVNHRGCGAGTGLARRPYHSGRAEDLSSAIEFGRKLFSGARHIAIGFSLSGNALLLLMSGKRGRAKPDFAMAVNAPINLHNCSKALGQGLNRIYDLHFVFQCRQEIHRQLPPEEAANYKISPWVNLYDFDNLYTAPASGFRDRDDYYNTCSTHNLLEEIETPTFVLTTKDDPFVMYADYAAAGLSSKVRLHVEDAGGHMGYLARERTPLGTNRWLDYAIHEVLRNL